jgi:hypothetical protein
MRIDAATYSDILSLMENIATDSSISDETRADVNIVRGAITAGDGGAAEFQKGSGTRAALGRLVGDKSQSSSLTSLINSASRFGEIPKWGWTEKNFRVLYDGSKILHGISDEDIATPELAIATLLNLRESITAEQKNHRPNDGHVSDAYALATLIQVLAAGGRIGGNVQPYTRLAGARDLYDRSKMLQNSPNAALKSPQAAVAYLVNVREQIIDEQRAIDPQKKIKSYALSTLVLALAAGGRIEGNVQPYTRLASACDLYDRSKILQETPNAALKSPQAAVAYLVSVREQIIDEQRAIDPQKKIKNYALSTLVQALAAGGRVEGNVQAYIRLTDARDLYDRSPTLQNLSQKIIDDDEALMRTLLAQRDRIAGETMRSNVAKNDFTTISKEEKWHSLATLILALHAAGRIDKKRAVRLDTTVGSPLSYFLKRQKAVGSEVRNLIRRGINRSIFHHIDRDSFTSIRDEAHVVGDQYVRKIVRWGRWFLTDPDVALRSIYGADEIAFMTLLGASVYGVDIPESAAMDLEIAAEAAADNAGDARRIAVEALVQINDSFIDASDIDEKTADFLKWTHRLVEWNSDALTDATPSNSFGSPTGSNQRTFNEQEIVSESFAGFLDGESMTISGAQQMLESEQPPMGLGITTQIGGKYFFTPIAPRFATPAAMPMH